MDCLRVLAVAACRGRCQKLFAQAGRRLRAMRPTRCGVWGVAEAVNRTGQSDDFAAAGNVHLEDAWRDSF